MEQRPQHTARLTVRKFHLWYSAVWVLLGLAPSAISLRNDHGPALYASMTVLAVLAAGYAAVRLRLAEPVLPPGAWLVLLALGVGAMAALPGGGAALFIVSLPQFWIHAPSPRAAIGLSGAAAGATVAGTLLHPIDSPTGNTVFTVAGFLAGVLLGLLVHRLQEDGEERAGRLGAELEGARQRLAEAHRQQGAADERERMAREIHDTLAQGFASIIVLAEAARSALDSDPERTAHQLRSIEQTARENFAEARVLVGSAPQSGLTPGPVVGTLRRTLERFAQDTGLTVDADLPPDVDCDQQTRIALLRCTQESLANVRKHADASTVGVVLTQHPYAIELEITDDGRGFTVGDSPGFGLDGMRKRLAELGGELTVTSSLGDGTRILATFHTAPAAMTTPATPATTATTSTTVTTSTTATEAATTATRKEH
ncbi:two-component sensor histidine kinase [Streptomyces venezuelae]|uniref:Two-component sensor histidine kinase n=1 Tax=Streptomyces venezuelae TaxID=54571 RepID=A0A5P2D598_STRVZ|nr:sensor histidine kinase [Streptomyces venezuelae]QES49367.1 two-component sensor histidine kinase [Streptomyces venezuelae]